MIWPDDLVDLQHEPTKVSRGAVVKDDLSKYLWLAVEEETVITRHGGPASVLIAFASEDDWFDYRLEHHPDFLRRVAEAPPSVTAGAFRSTTSDKCKGWLSSQRWRYQDFRGNLHLNARLVDRAVARA